MNIIMDGPARGRGGGEFPSSPPPPPPPPPGSASEQIMCVCVCVCVCVGRVGGELIYYSGVEIYKQNGGHVATHLRGGVVSYPDPHDVNFAILTFRPRGGGGGGGGQ